MRLNSQWSSNFGCHDGIWFSHDEKVIRIEKLRDLLFVKKTKSLRCCAIVFCVLDYVA